MSFHGTFGKVIRGAKFNEYCEYFDLDPEQAKSELTQRGYTVKAL